VIGLDLVLGNTISLADAIREIKAICVANPNSKPLFLMVGAGVSVPVIPLAGEIVAECKKSMSIVPPHLPEHRFHYAFARRVDGPAHLGL